MSIAEVDVVIITNRFATEEFARAWTKKVFSMRTPLYVKISEPYREVPEKVKYAPIAVDCEQHIQRRRTR